jgi:two-component system, NarL family, response regulator NreC
MPEHLQLAPMRSAPEAAGAELAIRVVLADDHAIVRRSFRLLLDRERDIEVVAEALDLDSVMRGVQRYAPHVLVLGIRTHDRSSVQTIRDLRARVPETHIVVLTMDASSVLATQALDAGATGLVLKERADGDLPAAIRCAVDGEEFVSPPVAARLESLRQAQRIDGLSAREVEILRLIALGYTSREIADQLRLSRRTIESHRAHIHHKLGLATRAELVRYALGCHLLVP